MKTFQGVVEKGAEVTYMDSHFEHNATIELVHEFKDVNGVVIPQQTKDVNGNVIPAPSQAKDANGNPIVPQTQTQIKDANGNVVILPIQAKNADGTLVADQYRDASGNLLPGFTSVQVPVQPVQTDMRSHVDSYGNPVQGALRDAQGNLINSVQFPVVDLKFIDNDNVEKDALSVPHKDTLPAPLRYWY